MQTARPCATDFASNSLPAWWKVCDFEDSRIKLHNFFQSDKLGISHGHFRRTNELPAMIVLIVGNQHN